MDSKFIFEVVEEVTEVATPTTIQHKGEKTTTHRILQSFPTKVVELEDFKVKVEETLNVKLKNRPILPWKGKEVTIIDDLLELNEKELEESKNLILDCNFARFNSCYSGNEEDANTNSERSQLEFLEMLSEKNRQDNTDSTDEYLSDDDDELSQIEGIISDESKFNRAISKFNRQTKANLQKIVPQDIPQGKLRLSFYNKPKNSQEMTLHKRIAHTIENLVIGAMGINHMFQLFENKRKEGVSILQKLTEQELGLKKERDLLRKEINALWDEQKNHLEPRLSNTNVTTYFNQIAYLLNQINETNNIFYNLMLNSNSKIAKFHQKIIEESSDRQTVQALLYPSDPLYDQFYKMCKSHKWDFSRDIFSIFNFKNENENNDNDNKNEEKEEEISPEDLHKDLICFMAIIESFKAIYPIQDLLHSQIFSKYSSHMELNKTITNLQSLKTSLQDQNSSLKSNFRGIVNIHHSLDRITGLVKEINSELSKKNQKRDCNNILKSSRGIQVSSMFLSTRENLITQFPQCEEFCSYEGAVFTEKGELKGSTVDTLLDFLISDQINSSKLDFTRIQKIFLLTFDYYLSARDLLEKLVIRYCTSPTNPILVSSDIFEFPDFDDLKINVQIPQRLKVIDILRQWIDLHFKRDFHSKPENLERLIDFLSNTVALTGNLTDAKSLYSQVRKYENNFRFNSNTKVDRTKSDLASSTPFFASSSTKNISSNNNNNKSNNNSNYNTTRIPKSASVLGGGGGLNAVNIMSYRDISLLSVNPADFANQLTIYEYEKFFKHLEPMELLHQVWNNKEFRETQAENVVHFVKHFNKVSAWIVRSILAEEKLEARAQIIRRVIVIGMNLLKLNNYNGVIEIMAGLRNSSIDRLLLSWELVGPQLFEVKQRLASLSFDKMKLFRFQWEKTLAPAIPYVGLFLTDLTFLEEGNSTFLGDEKKLINFFKFQRITETIELLLKHQSIPYSFPKISTFFDLFDELPDLKIDNIEEREWIKRSKELENPRDVSAVKRFKVKFDEEDTHELWRNLNLLRNHPLISTSPVLVVTNNFTENTINSPSTPPVNSNFISNYNVINSSSSSNVINTDILNDKLSEVQILPDNQGYIIGGKEYSLIQLEDIAGKLRCGLTVKERRYHMKYYKNTFLGAEAITWLTDHFILSRKDALLLGQILLQKNYFHHVTQSKDLKDKSNSIYQFVDKIQYNIPRVRKEKSNYKFN